MSDSNHTSVSNMMGAHGLELLATMLRAAGDTANATAIAAQATALKAAIVEKMWNGTHFCDGICAEVGGNSSLMTNMFALCFGMVPAANTEAAWKAVTDWGLEQIGDYGAFWYMMATAGGYYADATAQGKIAPYALDDGSAIVAALTKCDNYSWCSELRDDNATMTRESWHDGTYSHEWGTSAIVGVRRTAAAFYLCLSVSLCLSLSLSVSLCLSLCLTDVFVRWRGVLWEFTKLPRAGQRSL